MTDRPKSKLAVAAEEAIAKLDCRYCLARRGASCITTSRDGRRRRAKRPHQDRMNRLYAVREVAEAQKEETK